MELFYGLVTGILFGVLLQRAEVVRYDRQMGALRLKDMTILKFMLTAICVSMIGVYALHQAGMVKLAVKPLIMGGQVVGGLLFGLGWGLCGYCPGTSAGAAGEGRLDGVWTILGMLAGAGIYAEAYPLMNRTLLTWGVYGKLTIPQLLGVSPWVVIIAFCAGVVGLFRFFEARKL